MPADPLPTRRFTGAALLAHLNPAPSPGPTWLAFVLRPALSVCPCACQVDGRSYARAACAFCHGTGVALNTCERAA